MHELSVCQQIMLQVNDIAEQNQADEVTRIVLHIGPLSGVEAPLLKQAFPFAAAGSIAENSELLIQELPVVVQCAQCGKKTETQPNKLLCGHCGDYHTRLVSGDEMLLASVKLSRHGDETGNEASEGPGKEREHV